METLLILALGLAQGDPAKKALEEFRAAAAKAKSPDEKARAIGALAATRIDDPSFVPAVARYLAPAPGDVHSLQPVAAAEFLARLRGDRAAAQALLGALPSFKKIPFIHRRLLEALGRVGHESAVPTFEEILRAPDADQARVGLASLLRMPAHVAVEPLLREWDRRAKSDGDPLAGELLKALQKVTGEGYTTALEFQLWWRKRGPAFKEAGCRREKERSREAPASLPPVLIVELRFSENGMGWTSNTGASAAQAPTASFAGRPAWIGVVPPFGGPSALDFSAGSLDLAGAGESLRGLKSFTVTGWINARGSADGGRIVHWLAPKGDGVDLAWRADGALQLGVNQPADASIARSAPGLAMPAGPAANDQALGANWRFFAVTYDSTLPSGHAKFYVGTPAGDAALKGSADLARGHVGAKVSPSLGVGAASRPAGGDHPFRGLIDEVRIFGSTLDGAGALPLPQIIALQMGQPIP
jgi:hypothetical protein